MNKLVLIGNLTNDPEKRATNNGATVTSFTIAVNRKGKAQTDFFRINAWRGLADTCAKFLSKGRKVAVVGELQARTYEGKDGKTKFSLDVQAEEVEFLTPAEMKPTSDKPKADGWQDISTKDLPWEV